MLSTSAPQVSHRASEARPSATASIPVRIGNWELLRLIGEGQLTSVYQARPTGSLSDQPAGYAIKLLRPQWQDDPRGLGVLAREMQVSRKVSHPHLLPVLAGQLSQPPYYLAMPLLEGATLGDQLRLNAPLDLPVVFWNTRQVAEAIDALHQAEWMHADVKPSNIYVSSTGHVTLIDLGFARHQSERSSLADRTVVGTMKYMAPELLCSALGGDQRSDIYSLGVTLFELLTGRLPFDADDIAELAAQHRQELPCDLRALVPCVPKRAARLVQQMLAKEPLRRPAARDVVERLIALEIETFSERFSITATT